MSRNGSGTQASPASSFPAVANTLIESTKFNNVINDINASLTASIANDGQTPILANLPMSGFKHTGAATASAAGEYVEYAQYVTALAAKADTSTVAGKANAGANTDITSLASPALAGATATTQADGDNTTKVATTAFVTTATTNAVNAQKALDVQLAGSQTIAGVKTFQAGSEPIGLNLCKAWVTFDGTAAGPITPTKAFNVSSITKNGTGDFTLNFTDAMPDADYCVIGGHSGGALYAGAAVHAASASGAPTSKLTTSVRVRTSAASAEDKKQTYFAIFG